MKVLELSSDAARLADRRVRIVRDEPADEPSERFDLVFQRAEDESLVPEDAIYRWKFDDYGREPFWLFTTEDRCRKTVSEDPADWTREKLAGIKLEEEKLWRAWANDDVFGWILEKWDPADRRFAHESSCFGYYGADEVLGAVEEEVLRGESGAAVCAEDGLAAELGEKAENARA